MNKFNIGDSVFKGEYGKVETHVSCPDCGGTRHVTVVLHDQTEIQIECGGCDPGGYRGPTGTVTQYVFTTIAKPFTVTGFTIREGSVEYELNNYGGGFYYTAKEGELFSNSSDAMSAAETQRIEHEAEENKRLMAKTKDAKSWAWNATYHRKCIKDHERQLEYHRSKVKICESKGKESL